MNARFDNTRLNLKGIKPHINRIARHPVFEAVRTQDDLRTFMRYHVYAVWDFMSLCKFLQNTVAPTTLPWVHDANSQARRFINRIVLDEESDQGPPGSNPEFMSHYELYCTAMREIGAETQTVQDFVEIVQKDGIRVALKTAPETTHVPDASRTFMAQTFAFIETGKLHVVAAAFAFGREHILSPMFQTFLKSHAVTKKDTPAFHFYLERHIHLDENFHAPSALRLLNILIDGDASKAREANAVALQAIDARTKLWDSVFDALPGNVAAAQ